jgi:hypothetical protein
MKNSNDTIGNRTRDLPVCSVVPQPMRHRVSPPPKLRSGVEIDTCVEEVSSAITEALAASAPRRRPRDDPRPQIPVHIQDDIRLKNRLRRQWQITRDPALKAEVNRLQRSVIHQLNEWRNEQWSATLGSLDPEDQSLWKMTKRVMRVPTPSPPLVTPGGLALSDSEKAEALADSLEAALAGKRPVGSGSY